MDRRVTDWLKEVSAFTVVAPRRIGQVLIVLSFKVGLDQPAKRSGLWSLRPLRLGDSSDRLAFCKELGRTNRCWVRSTLWPVSR